MLDVRKLLIWLRAVFLRNAFCGALLGGVVAASCMLSIFAVLMMQEREEVKKHAQEQASNLAVIVDRDIARNFELYSLSLQAIAEGWRRPELMALPEDLRRAALFDGSLTARYISSAIILDRNGQLVLNLKKMTPVIRDFSDQGYFQSHKRSADDGVLISESVSSHQGATTVNVALSRRLSGVGGAFEGVAVLFLDVNYFRDLLQGLEIGPRGRTTIYGPEGKVLMSIPYRATLISADRSASPIYRRVAETKNGSFVAPSVFDDKERLFVFRTLPDVGIKVMIALATEDIYAPWHLRAGPVVIAVVTFAAGLILISALLGRELHMRTRAETRMKLLSDTDDLTGLANRRALDRILCDEGSRSTRGTGGLGVLFADVDYFKLYNDTKGHQEGDVVLAAVAQAMQQATRRPGDKTGRYGGEEFLTVLAYTDAEGARIVAEKMRAAVQMLNIRHPASPLGVITVSIGVAAMSQGGFSNVHDVVKAADQALYTAKEAGRNRVHLHQ